MASFTVPDLQRKFAILIVRGKVSDKKEIAALLGKSVKTIDWWAHGTPTRQPGLIPLESAEALIDLFSLCFPSGTNRTDIANALTRPGFEYEATLQAAWSMSWEELIAKHASTEAGNIHLKRPDFNLVEVEDASCDPVPRVPLDHWFRAEFRSDLAASHVLALQHAPGAIGVVPAAYDPVLETIHLPPCQADRSFAYMRERRDVGRHLFVAVQLETSLPDPIRRMFETSIPITSDSLQRLTAHLISLRNGWRLYTVALTVFRR